MPKTNLNGVYGSLAAMWRLNPGMFLLAIISLLSLCLSLIGLCNEHTIIQGENAWIKPLKFSLSFVLYAGSLIFISQYLSASKKFLKITSNVALLGAVAELAAIISQSMLAPLAGLPIMAGVETMLWYAVKISIMPVAFAVIAMLWMLLKEKHLPPILGSSICWGTVLAIVGFIPGFLLLLPDSMQHAFTNQDAYGQLIAHASASSRIPYLGWSKVVGDLRVAHFFGLHALQILPLIGYGITKGFVDLSVLRQKVLVSISGFTYFAFIILLTFQALRGESVFSPGHQSLLAALTITAIASAAVALTVMPIRIPRAAHVSL